MHPMIPTGRPATRRPTAASVTRLGFPGYSVYAATKSAVETMTNIFAKELRGRSITVNAVAPGPTATHMYDQLPQSRRDDVMRSVYAGRVCQPQEVGEAIFWLGSTSPEYINGTTLDVNSGSYPR